MLRATVLSGAAILIAACGPEPNEPEPAETATPEPPAATPVPAPEPASELTDQPDRPEALARVASIDWTAARTDLASQPSDVTPQAFQVESGDLAPPVPVLLPTGIVTAQTVEGRGPTYQPLDDGYFASYPGPVYSVTISGTNVVYDTNGEDAGDMDAVFVPTMTGGQVSLSRYGADYLIEFECVGPGAGNACIDEAEALDVARGLVIAGSR